MPRTTAPPTIGETPTTRPRVARSASRMPGTPRIVPIDTTGLDGASRTASAVANASTTPGAGRAASTPTCTKAVGVERRAVPHPPLLEVDGLLPAGLRVVDDDVGLDPLVAHRQQP